METSNSYIHIATKISYSLSEHSSFSLKIEDERIKKVWLFFFRGGWCIKACYSDKAIVWRKADKTWNVIMSRDLKNKNITIDHLQWLSKRWLNCHFYFKTKDSIMNSARNGDKYFCPSTVWFSNTKHWYMYMPILYVNERKTHHVLKIIKHCNSNNS